LELPPASWVRTGTGAKSPGGSSRVRDERSELPGGWLGELGGTGETGAGPAARGGVRMRPARLGVGRTDGLGRRNRLGLGLGWMGSGRIGYVPAWYPLGMWLQKQLVVRFKFNNPLCLRCKSEFKASFNS
jgi:hypothetical protein